jgi:non-specific serine/threonine protein kinase
VECATRARTLGEAQLLAVNLGNLAIVVHARGDSDKAVTLFEESLKLARKVGDSFLTSEALSARGRAECRDGNLESAEASFVESLTIAGDLTDPDAAAQALEGFAELAFATHAPKRAATILGAAARLREEIGLALSVREEREHKRLAAAARAALGDAAFDQAWREGSAMELEDAVRYALNDQLPQGA